MSLLKRFKLLRENRKGAISVEYVFSMAIAAIIMIGVQVLFERMSVDIVNQFKEWVKTFP